MINTIRYEGFPHHKLFILLILLGLLTLTTLITQWHICIHNCSIVTVLFLHMTIWHYGLRSKKGGWVTDYSATLHNVHFVKYDGPAVKMALYKLQGHIM